MLWLRTVSERGQRHVPECSPFDTVSLTGELTGCLGGPTRRRPALYSDREAGA